MSQLHLIAFSVLTALSIACAKSYEGYLVQRDDNRLIPVWVDLRDQKIDGAIDGSYFYRRVGKPIELVGTRKGAAITLSEETGGKVTGFLNCTDHGDSITGEWKPSAKGKALGVLLYPADSADRKYAVWSPKKLMLAKSERIEAATLDEYLDQGRENDDGDIPITQWAPYIWLCRNGILSLSVDNSATGAYTTDWTDFFTFDLKTKQEIVLIDQIDPAKRPEFVKLLNKELQPKLDAFRKESFERLPEDIADPDYGFSSQVPADVWIYELMSDYCRERLIGNTDTLTFATDSAANTYMMDRAFTAQCDHLCGDERYALTSEGLRLTCHGYFCFPHVIQCYDMGVDVTIPYVSLMPLLRKGSVLSRLR